MADYTFDPFRSHPGAAEAWPGAAATRWGVSFLFANALLLVLVLLLMPLVNTGATVMLGPPNPTIEFDPADQASLADAKPPADLPPEAVPVAAPLPTDPPPIVPTPPTASPVPPSPPAPAPAPADVTTATAPPQPPPARDPSGELVWQSHPAIQDHPPAGAKLAGEENSKAQSSHPTPGMHDPVPLQPDGVSPVVLASGGPAGSETTKATGRTVAETAHPAQPSTKATPPITPPLPPEKANPPPVVAPPVQPTGTPDHVTSPPQPVQTPPVIAGAPEATGIGNVEIPVNVPVTTLKPELPQPPPAPVEPDGQKPTTVKTATETPALDPLAAERARLAALNAADKSKPAAGTSGTQSTAEIHEQATAGDPRSVTKTPFLNVSTNTDQAGEDAIETYKEPVTRYLRDFRKILEQNFFREASPPRNYHFRDGEFADFEMTFHADGTIDGVAKVSDTATKSFTPEMEVICKTAITRSSPYKAFTEELLQERKEFKLTIRFHF